MQRLADRISAVFVPAVLVIALVTLAGWLLVGGSAEHAFSAAISVLIIACPCALGLATPTALLVASGQGARQGIFFKGYQALEASRQVDTVVLDKTGTVTEGRMAVTDVDGRARHRTGPRCCAGRGRSSRRPSTSWPGPSPPPPARSWAPCPRSTGSWPCPGSGPAAWSTVTRSRWARRELFAGSADPVPPDLLTECAAVGGARTDRRAGRVRRRRRRGGGRRRHDPTVGRRRGATNCRPSGSAACCSPATTSPRPGPSGRRWG